MKVCIVGNGPSAKGRGREIDACDFVVRMKAFWLYGAEDAGEKIDAWAWYGHTGTAGDGVPVKDISSQIPRHIEHWFTRCDQQAAWLGDDGQLRVRKAKNVASRDVFHQLTDQLWSRANEYLYYHPSTGFVTLAMALHRWPDAAVVLYGFDSTTPERPNYYDARPPVNTVGYTHHVLTEKRAIAEIHNGTWLGKPTAATLTWPDMPKGL
jgi:hypothetical protein